MPLDERVRGKTEILGLIGNPVGHTVSPQLHNTLSTMLGIDAIYIPMRVEKEFLGDAVRGFKAAGFKGFNVTIPFKEEILKHVDVLSDEVKLAGCANTVKLAGGLAYAYNTDAEGFAVDFEEKTGSSFKGKRVLLLGAGGTSRSIALKIAGREASQLCIANRTVERAEEIASLVKGVTVVRAETAGLKSLEDQAFIRSFDVIINTTSLGMHPRVDESPLNSSIKLDERQIVYDVLYNPSRTKLLKHAEDCGCKAVNGLGMLFRQGILAYEIWMDLKVPEEALKRLWQDFSNYLSG